MHDPLYKMVPSHERRRFFRKIACNEPMRAGGPRQTPGAAAPLPAVHATTLDGGRHLTSRAVPFPSMDSAPRTEDQISGEIGAAI